MELIMKPLSPLLLLLTLLLPNLASAATLILIHGYQNDGDIWRRSGIAGLLHQSGWIDQGHLVPVPGGAAPLLPSPMAGANRLYTLSLPDEAPLLVQSDFLANYLNEVARRHPDEPMLLVGHSAGGVVARVAMVRQPQRPVAALVTIASPHLGTETVELGILAGNSPFAWVAPWVGAGMVNRSQALYHDLRAEYPGSHLFMLNRQPHPASNYISLVRPESAFLFGSGDTVVPTFSQDMNNVAALAGRVTTLPAPGRHGLNPADGVQLVHLLQPYLQ
jgi:triacylglycerol lipase